jgi:cystathionine beta-lyase
MVAAFFIKTRDKLMSQYNFDILVHRENTESVKYDLRNRIFGKDDVLPMWVADMDFETPDFIREALLKRAGHPIYGYTFRSPSYADSIREWVTRRHQWTIQNDWIVFSPGVVPAFNFAVLSLTKPGDGILIQPPVYFPFFSAVNDHNRKLLQNQLVYKEGMYTIDFNDFEDKAKEASLFLLSNPHNPIGRVWTRDELTKMAEICQKYGVLILSDEIHNDLILPGNKHTVLAGIDPAFAEITLTCIAPSKTFNMAGLSTSSVVISNDELRKKYAAFIDALHLSGGNLFGAVASEAGYRHGDRWVDELMKYVKNNIGFLSSHLKQYTDIQVVDSQATYMVWLDFKPTGLDDETIQHKLIHDSKLGLSHGPVFGPGGEGFQRINLAAPRQLIVEAAERLSQTFSIR